MMIRRAIEDMTNFIFMEDQPEKCDLILIPGTAKSATTVRAAELYRQGYAPYVMPSGRYSYTLGRFASEKIDNPRYLGDYETEFEYMKKILMDNGVPESAILKEDQATNTVQNAQFSAEVVRNAGLTVRKAIICCKAFHARRAYLSYACFFPETELLIIPTKTPGLGRDDWYLSEKGYQLVLTEIAKCGSYFQSMMDYIAR